MRIAAIFFIVLLLTLIDPSIETPIITGVPEICATTDIKTEGKCRFVGAIEDFGPKFT